MNVTIANTQSGDRIEYTKVKEFKNDNTICNFNYSKYGNY